MLRPYYTLQAKSSYLNLDGLLVLLGGGLAGLGNVAKLLVVGLGLALVTVDDAESDDGNSDNDEDDDHDDQDDHASGHAVVVGQGGAVGVDGGGGEAELLAVEGAHSSDVLAAVDVADGAVSDGGGVGGGGLDSQDDLGGGGEEGGGEVGLALNEDAGLGDTGALEVVEEGGTDGVELLGLEGGGGDGGEGDGEADVGVVGGRVVVLGGDDAEGVVLVLPAAGGAGVGAESEAVGGGGVGALEEGRLIDLGGGPDAVGGALADGDAHGDGGGAGGVAVGAGDGEGHADGLVGGAADLAGAAVEVEAVGGDVGGDAPGGDEVGDLGRGGADVDALVAGDGGGVVDDDGRSVSAVVDDGAPDAGGGAGSHLVALLVGVSAGDGGGLAESGDGPNTVGGALGVVDGDADGGGAGGVGVAGGDDEAGGADGDHRGAGDDTGDGVQGDAGGKAGADLVGGDVAGGDGGQGGDGVVDVDGDGVGVVGDGGGGVHAGVDLLGPDGVVDVLAESGPGTGLVGGAVEASSGAAGGLRPLTVLAAVLLDDADAQGGDGGVGGAGGGDGEGLSAGGGGGGAGDDAVDEGEAGGEDKGIDGPGGDGARGGGNDVDEDADVEGVGGLGVVHADLVAGGGTGGDDVAPDGRIAVVAGSGADTGLAGGAGEVGSLASEGLGPLTIGGAVGGDATGDADLEGELGAAGGVGSGDGVLVEVGADGGCAGDDTGVGVEVETVGQGHVHGVGDSGGVDGGDEGGDGLVHVEGVGVRGVGEVGGSVGGATAEVGGTEDGTGTDGLLEAGVVLGTVGVGGLAADGGGEGGGGGAVGGDGRDEELDLADLGRGVAAAAVVDANVVALGEGDSVLVVGLRGDEGEGLGLDVRGVEGLGDAVEEIVSGAVVVGAFEDPAGGVTLVGVLGVGHGVLGDELAAVVVVGVGGPVAHAGLATEPLAVEVVIEGHVAALVAEGELLHGGGTGHDSVGAGVDEGGEEAEGVGGGQGVGVVDLDGDDVVAADDGGAELEGNGASAGDGGGDGSEGLRRGGDGALGHVHSVDLLTVDVDDGAAEDGDGVLEGGLGGEGGHGEGRSVVLGGGDGDAEVGNVAGTPAGGGVGELGPGVVGGGGDGGGVQELPDGVGGGGDVAGVEGEGEGRLAGGEAALDHLGAVGEEHAGVGAAPAVVGGIGEDEAVDGLGLAVGEVGGVVVGEVGLGVDGLAVGLQLEAHLVAIVAALVGDLDGEEDVGGDAGGDGHGHGGAGGRAVDAGGLDGEDGDGGGVGGGAVDDTVGGVEGEAVGEGAGNDGEGSVVGGGLHVGQGNVLVAGDGVGAVGEGRDDDGGGVDGVELDFSEGDSVGGNLGVVLGEGHLVGVEGLGVADGVEALSLGSGLPHDVGLGVEVRADVVVVAAAEGPADGIGEGLVEVGDEAVLVDVLGAVLVVGDLDPAVGHHAGSEVGDPTGGVLVIDGGTGGLAVSGVGVGGGDGEGSGVVAGLADETGGDVEVELAGEGHTGGADDEDGEGVGALDHVLDSGGEGALLDVGGGGGGDGGGVHDGGGAEVGAADLDAVPVDDDTAGSEDSHLEGVGADLAGDGDGGAEEPEAGADGGLGGLGEAGAPGGVGGVGGGVPVRGDGAGVVAHHGARAVDEGVVELEGDSLLVGLVEEVPEDGELVVVADHGDLQVGLAVPAETVGIVHGERVVAEGKAVLGAGGDALETGALGDDGAGGVGDAPALVEGGGAAGELLDLDSGVGRGAALEDGEGDGAAIDLAGDGVGGADGHLAVEGGGGGAVELTGRGVEGDALGEGAVAGEVLVAGGVGGQVDVVDAGVPGPGGLLVDEVGEDVHVAAVELNLGDLEHVQAGLVDGVDLELVAVVGLGVVGDVEVDGLLSGLEDDVAFDVQQLPGVAVVVATVELEVLGVSAGEVVGGGDGVAVDPLALDVLVLEGDGVGAAEGVGEPLGLSVVIEGLVLALASGLVGVGGDDAVVGSGDALSVVEHEVAGEGIGLVGLGVGLGVELDGEDDGVGHDAAVDDVLPDAVGDLAPVVAGIRGDGGVAGIDDAGVHVSSVDLLAVYVHDDAVLGAGAELEEGELADVDVNGEGGGVVSGGADGLQGEGAGSVGDPGGVGVSGGGPGGGGLGDDGVLPAGGLLDVVLGIEVPLGPLTTVEGVLEELDVIDGEVEVGVGIPALTDAIVGTDGVDGGLEAEVVHIGLEGTSIAINGGNQSTGGGGLTLVEVDLLLGGVASVETLQEDANCGGSTGVLCKA